MGPKYDNMLHFFWFLTAGLKLHNVELFLYFGSISVTELVLAKGKYIILDSFYFVKTCWVAEGILACSH